MASLEGLLATLDLRAHRERKEVVMVPILPMLAGPRRRESVLHLTLSRTLWERAETAWGVTEEAGQAQVHSGARWVGGRV